MSTVPEASRDLAGRLAEAEATIEALLAGQIDAVVDPKGHTLVLLRQAQEALRASEQRYRQIVETTNEGVCLVNAEHTMVFVNRRMAEMLRTEPQAALGRSVFEFLDAEEQLKLAASLDRPGSEPVELRYTCADGSRLWTVVETAPALDGAGQREGFLVMVRDVTERRHGEAALREITADLQERSKTLEQHAAALTEQAALLDLAQDAIVVRDTDNRVVFWSRGAEVMYGWAREEALGRDADELLRTEWFERAEPIHAALVAHGRWEGEAIHQKRDGTRMAVASRWALRRETRHAPARILVITSDITDRKRGDLDRALLTNRLSMATALGKVGVWEWDLGSGSFTWDVTMCAFYGLPLAAQMPYERWATAVYSDDLPAIEDALRRVVETRSEGACEFRIVRSDGALRNMASVHKVVVGERNEVTSVIGVDIDVTDQKESERLVEQSHTERLRHKDEFLSHVSHELRSPLTAIKQFSSILLGGLAGELNPEQRQYQLIVLRNIGQLQSMIDDLLEVTRLQTRKLTFNPASASVAEAVKDAMQTLQGAADGKGVTLSCHLQRDLPSGFADPTRFRQILIVLLDNAIKFTPAGGMVTIHAQIAPQSAQFIQVQVRDTGRGMTAATVKRIFERLYQSSDGPSASRTGLGLGLFICRELVTQQGGTISVDSQPNVGSQFSFTLPVFSVNAPFVPLLKNGKWPGDSLALFMVELRAPQGHSAQRSRLPWVAEARTLLQRCLNSDVHVLLPTTASSADAERFFVAAFADESAACVLDCRIREELERFCDRADQSFTVCHEVLAPSPPEIGAAVAAIVGAIDSSREAIEPQTLLARSVSRWR